MSGQPTYSQPVLESWGRHFTEAAHAENLAEQGPELRQALTDLDRADAELDAEYRRRKAEIQTARERADAAYTGHGRAVKAAEENAAGWRRFVERECAEMGLPLPPSPPEAGQTRPDGGTPLFEAVKAHTGQNPPAGTAEDLGTAVAGQATTKTANDGGDQPAMGRFQPETGA